VNLPTQTNEDLALARRWLLAQAAWNLALAAAFVRFGWAYRLWKALDPTPAETPLTLHLLLPKYLGIYFALAVIVNLPFEFVPGRQRRSIERWASAVAVGFVWFFVSASMLLMAQTLLPRAWLWAVGAMLLIAVALSQQTSALAKCATWVWVMLGILVVNHLIDPGWRGTPVYVARMMVGMIPWMTLGLLGTFRGVRLLTKSSVHPERGSYAIHPASRP